MAESPYQCFVKVNAQQLSQIRFDELGNLRFAVHSQAERGNGNTQLSRGDVTVLHFVRAQNAQHARGHPMTFIGHLFHLARPDPDDSELRNHKKAVEYNEQNNDDGR